MVIRHSSNICLTDKIFLQTHVTFCEYLVFREFRRNLYITLAKYLEQEGVYVSVVTCGRALVCACRYVGVGVRVCRYVCVCTRACRVCVCVCSS